ncbi:hypothetical protein AOQ84DRAFT_350600 [Glonium stellatum]|uniref:Uncharacterized protein n=1 Tax=Glonium stellatum TaxID=574774 RepID=A0A8E2EMR6_9PEZI|nr:hypothetical protein AOQ84DRAFT_350600 [Glonium stellatum]
MPSIEREDSRDRDLVVKHQHSFSEASRSHIPMWDSSDPDRAPPPLPLNPGSPNLAIRPNTSAAIAATARALEEKARESAPASSYTTNPMPQKSPERALIKGAQHKRMQSLQTTSVRDLRSFLDGVRSPDRSPERPVTRSGTPTQSRESDRDYLLSSPDKSPTRSGTPTPIGREILKDTPALRPSSRPLQKAILGENTPPSATMLALQTMSIPREHLDPPLSNVTNSNTPIKSPQTFEAISSQLLSITNIASNLQKEMAQLSRRSKDNATDLISLKEATNSRDEDIRKCLRELVTTVNLQVPHGAFLGPPADMSRSNSAFSAGYERKDLNSTPPGPPKTFSLPRIPSPGSFIIDDRVGSPNPYSVEGAASVAMLEKIIREMVTKDGQERLLATLSTLFDKAKQESGETAKKVTELVEFIKEGSQSQALIARGGGNGAGINGVGAGFQPSPGTGPLARTTRDLNASFGTSNGADGQKPYSSPKAADFVSEEMLKYLRKIKDSVTESGCMTAETKSLIRDLRGEVLGMGRELGRKIDEAEKARGTPPAIESGEPQEDIGKIVKEGLAEVKEHLDRVIREKRRQSSSSNLSRNTVDSQEVYDVVKHALAERGLDHPSAHANSGLDKEAILNAVREAYEAYKPEIELQQFGLERDEILQCLREGLEDYRNSAPPESTGVSKEEVMDAIHEAFQHFNPPAPINEAHEIREEMLGVVRECLEEFKPTMAVSAPPQDFEITKEIILDAVKEGLANHDPNGPREIEISREDLFEAVKAGLEGSHTPLEGFGEQVMTRLQELVDDMRSEFKSYSSANGRDTEQVLDAIKDGLETLRAEIESYVDKAQDVTGKDEIIDTMRGELERLRADVQGFVAEGPRGDHALSRGDMLAYIKSEFEHLHEELSSQFLPAAKDKDDILEALNSGFESMKSQVAVRDIDSSSNDEMTEAMKEEFEQLKDVVLGGSASHKDEILEGLQSGFESIQAKLSIPDAAAHPNDDVLASMKEEFEHLRETLATTLVRSGGSSEKDDIIDAVRESFDGLRTQLLSEQGDASKETLGTIQGELEHLRETLGTTLVRSGDSVEKEEILATLKTGLDEIRSHVNRPQPVGLNEELIEAFRGELEQLRQSIATGLARHNSRADTEEVLDAVRLGLDDLRSHLEKRIDNPDRQMSATGEILDALNEGLETLKTDVAKMVDKPIDMTVSYEILETLKEGLVSLKEDMGRLKGKQEVEEEEEVIPTGNEVVLAEDPETAMTREIPAVNSMSDSLRRNDLEKMEVMLAQLQIKIEAMDANIQNPPPPPPPPPTVLPEPQPMPDSAMKDDLVGIEELLKDIQAQVSLIETRERENVDGLATKEDTDAIETLLRNTKATIDEMSFPDLADAATKEHIESVEAVVRASNDAIETLAARIEENGATKGDVAVVEVLVQDMKAALEELKETKPTEDEGEKLTKTDFDTLALLCMDIKTKVEEMKIPEADLLPSKADVEQLTGLIHDFRDSHDKMKDSYEADIAITAKAFDDRKKEAESLVESIADVKVVLDEIKEEIKNNLREGGQGVEGLTESFKSLEDTIGSNFNITADVKELMETVTREFERAHGSVEGLKIEQDEKSAATLEKHNEVKEAIIAELCQKLDDRFDTIMAKYDDAQLLAEAQTKAMEEKAAQQEEILANTKAMAEELRLTIDTLGASITGLGASFTETSDKMAQDSQTVFGRIDEAVSKLDEQHGEVKTEHQQTREEVANAVRAINGLQGDVTEFHPKFMVTLREILALVNQHYEHSQQTKTSTEEQVRAIADETRARADEMRNNFSNLPALLPPPPPAIELPEKYDDAEVQEKLDRLLNHASDVQVQEKLDILLNHASDVQVQEKLDQLLNHASDAEKSTAQLERLDQIHRQVMHTAAEVTEFVAKQTQLITEGHESKEREAEEIALVIERRLAQKEQLETDIQGLKEDKDSLLSIVAALQIERENLANQKVRLTGEVSSLQTALEIRREELHAMDAKADALERRVLNGIMDHSRALLLSKSDKGPVKSKKQRVTSNVSQNALGNTPSPSAAANGLALALKPRPAIRRNGPPPNPASRRILSLSQITNNVPTGAQAYSGASNNMSNGLVNLKRSHSVKTQFMRKRSWGKRHSLSAVNNKENEVLSEESDIEGDENSRAIENGPRDLECDDYDGEHDDLGSDAGTERRHSYATGAGSYVDSYADGNTPGYSESRGSYGPTDSEYTYGTGSYITGSDVDRRTSYGSTSKSRRLNGAIHEEEEDEVSGDDHAGGGHEHNGGAEERSGEGNAQKDIVLFAGPTDSGIGTDVPSTALEHSEADYFRRAAEEESVV